MFRKIISGIFVNNDSAINHRGNEQKALSSLGSNLSDINNQNVDCLVTSNTGQLLGKEGKNTEGFDRNAFSSSLRTCENNTNIDRQQHSSVMFSSLMGPPMPKQNPFIQMTLAELLDSNLLLASPPTSKEFKVILFNDSMKTCRFGFKQELIADIKSALLACRAPSYKYLASIAIGIAQSTLVITDLKNKGVVNGTEFSTLNSKLTKYAVDCTKIGNAYHDRLITKPGLDTWTSFLVIETHRDDKFSNLYKQSYKVDEDLKNIVRNRDGIKEGITQNLDYIVNRFIYNHFQLQQSSESGVERLDLTKYIKKNALGQIQALFANDCRSSKTGHQFDIGGVEHIYDCYAEMFDHFITVNKKSVHN